ncbi:MAG: DUF2333 family protein [Deltaproteobacteria bacterium]|nr:DUF2333 family protein [Deltaproteobacteria bacterium]
MFRPPRRSGRVLILLWLSGMLALWIGQGRHNRLPMDFGSGEFAEHTFQPGEIFASTLIALMAHELQDGFGWRPNDFFLWGPRLWADNNASRQLGLLQTFRESLRVFKEHLTKVSINEYDPNLLEADTLFENEAERFWFPSAESRFAQGIERLRLYVSGVRDGSPSGLSANHRRNLDACIIEARQKMSSIREELEK